MTTQHYYSYQTHRWLTDREQEHFGLNYAPQPTRELALQELNKYLVRQLERQIEVMTSWIQSIKEIPWQSTDKE